MQSPAQPPLPPPADRPLSPHFWLSEFTDSQAASRLALANSPGPVATAWLGQLASVLEQVRTLCNDRPLVISSGFRSPDVNRAVGGSPNSAHLEGRAADFSVPGLSRLEVCRRIATSGLLPFDQLIFEGTWVHLGIARAGEPMRRQVLSAVFAPGQKTRYVPGLPAAPT